MATLGEPGSPVDGERRKKTFYLLIGGVASLLIPALWLLYGKLNEAPSGSVGLDPNEIFTKRGSDGGNAMKITPAASQAAPGASFMPGAFMNGATPAPVAVGAGATSAAAQAAAQAPAGGGGAPQDSMAFIRGGNDYQEKAATPPAAPAPAPAPVQKPAPVAAPPAPAPVAKAAPKQRVDPFAGKHLGTGGLKGGFGQQGQKGMGGAQGMQGMGQTGAMPKGGVPPGAAGLAPGAGGAQPDMSQIMKNLPPGTQLPAGAGQMMQNMPTGTQVPQNIPNIPGLGAQPQPQQ